MEVHLFSSRGAAGRESILFREDSGHIRLAEHLPGFVHFLKMLTTTKRLLMRSIATLCIATVFLARAEGTDYYTHYPKGCVNGKNILKFTGKTVEQCKEICSAMSNCVAFEFGVAYGGARGNYQPGDCQPQSSTSRSGCDGSQWNLDLYVKDSPPPTPPPPTPPSTTVPLALPCLPEAPDPPPANH